MANKIGRPKQGEERGYKGNINLKPVNKHIDWTEELLDEYTKCAVDIKYFLENYVKIDAVDDGLVKFQLRDYQHRMIDSIVDNRYTIMLTARQIGKSTITAAVALHYALFRSRYKVGLLANKDDLAKELLDKIFTAFENLPLWLQQGVKKMDAHELVLENGSRIFARATSKSAVRGRSINCLILDEFAHINENLAQEFYASTFPTISSGKTTKLVIISTPKGYNLYHKLWTDAENQRNTFNPVKVLWYEVPGRDEAWRKEQIANTSEELFRQEHECSFDSSSNGLITAEKIRELMSTHIQPIEKDDDNCLLIYERPKENEKYIITVDTAKGVEKDYSAFQVIKVTTSTYEVVAVYRSNKISTLVYPDVINKVGLNYNKADLFIENNEYGHQITTILTFELEYPNIIWTELSNKKQRISYGSDSKALPGIRTTSSVKNIGCSNLKALVEHNKLKIPDYDTISELSSFTRVKESYQADEGKHDDLVMCLVLFSWLTTQDYFKDIEQNVGEDIRGMHQDNINSNLLSIGFFTTGKEEEQEFDDDYEKDYNDGWRVDKKWDCFDDEKEMREYFRL